MTTLDKASSDQGDIDDMLDDPVWENLTDIDERVAMVLGEGKDQGRAGRRTASCPWPIPSR